jgi:hypothetical protein
VAICPRSDGQLVPAHVDAVDQHLAGVHVRKPRDERRDRALAGPGRPDQRDVLAGLDRQAQVPQHRLPAVRERDVAELDLAADRHRHRTRHVDDVDRRVHHLADPLQRGRALADHLGQLGQLLDRLVERAEVGDEHEQHTEAEVSGQHPLGAEPEHRRGREHAGDLDQRAEPGLHPHRLDTGGQAGLGQPGEVPEPLVLQPEDLDQVDRGQVLGRRRSQRAVGLADPAGGRAQLLAGAPGGPDQRRRGQQRQHGEDRVEGHHHHEHADHQRGGRQQRGQHLHQHVLRVRDVAGHPGGQVADPVLAVEPQRLPLQPGQHRQPQVVGHVQAGGGQQPGGPVVGEAGQQHRARPA